MRCGMFLIFMTLSMASLHADEPDLVIADFEQETYGNWKVEGTAFGPGPARGTLAGQMNVDGFEGKGLVNSFFNGDDTKGKLTSPEFKIERKYINFLIGGGKHPDKACINLIVADQIVRTSTGPNGQAGGTERLEWDDWDVEQWRGKTARIQIVDDIAGGWGHINIDQITQSNRGRASIPIRKSLAIKNRYLAFNVRTGAPMRRVNFLFDDKLVYEADIELEERDPEFSVLADLSAYQGKVVVLEAKLPRDSHALDAVTQTDSVPEKSDTFRPLVHFTSRRGWLNDPNGLVFYRGEWHLFYQHNPFGWAWGNMHWGHAVSRDLLNWEELPTALFAKSSQDMAFSGSAVVDYKNSSGFQKGNDHVLVGAYTSTGRGECIVYSQDRGRTWHEYQENPVVKHAGRDPRLFWHDPSQQWVMAIYDETPEAPQAIVFYTSPNLKTWSFASRIAGFFECPDIFPIKVDGKGETKWVLSAADGKYVLGQFDGKTFTPEFDYTKNGKLQFWYGNFYAAQTFSDAPDGRRVQIGWGSGIEFRGKPFNQQMTIPVELTLRSTPNGPRIFAWPVREWDSAPRASARTKGSIGEIKAAPGIPEKIPSRSADKVAELFDLQTTVEPGSSTKMVLTVRGNEIEYDTAAKLLKCQHVTVPMPLSDGKISLRIIGDRGSLEIFANRGEVAISLADKPKSDPAKWQFEAFGAEGKLRDFTLEMWQPSEPIIEPGR